MAPRLLTVQEAAAALHRTVTVAAIRKAIHAGLLPASRIGKRYYVMEQELEAFACRALANPPASTSEKTNSNGSSVTETTRFGRDMAVASIERLKMRSSDTARAESRPSGEVLPIRAS